MKGFFTHKRFNYSGYSWHSRRIAVSLSGEYYHCKCSNFKFLSASPASLPFREFCILSKGHIIIAAYPLEVIKSVLAPGLNCCRLKWECHKNMICRGLRSKVLPRATINFGHFLHVKIVPEGSLEGRSFRPRTQREPRSNFSVNSSLPTCNIWSYRVRLHSTPEAFVLIVDGPRHSFHFTYEKCRMKQSV